MIGLIGGTGIYDTSLLKDVEERIMANEYGNTKVYIGKYLDKQIVFMPRHGIEHDKLAYQINYHANMQALRDLGVDTVLATAAVGSMNLEMKGGDLVLLDQFVDFTVNRVYTYGKYSVNMTEPYCPALRGIISGVAQELGIKMHPRGTYLCLDGPRYETAAEIKLFRNWGMDVVGMTNAPEAILAREQGMHYATLAIVTNYCAGVGEDIPDLTAHRKAVKENMGKVQKLLYNTIKQIPTQLEGCQCEELFRKAIAARKSK